MNCVSHLAPETKNLPKSLWFKRVRVEGSFCRVA